MKPQAFEAQLDEGRVAAAIAAAERRTSGEIRVWVSHESRDDALAAARQRFFKLGMDQTRERNAVLLYFAPRSHQFAVWADEGVNGRCGEEAWQGIVQLMAPLLKNGQYTEAVEAAVGRVGDFLAQHFPRRPDDRNELPDHVVRD